MPRRSDASVIAENLGCEIAGLTPAKRRDWVKKGLLDQPTSRSKLSELQVVHLALVRELNNLLGPRDGGIVWLELKKLLTDRVPAGDLDLVVDLGYREVTLVSDRDAIGDAVRTTRPIRVIPLGPLITRVREAFRRVAASPTGRAAKRGQPRARRAR
jgi:hypothetical protein